MGAIAVWVCDGPDPVGLVAMSRPETGGESEDLTTPADRTAAMDWSRNRSLEAARDVLGLTVPELWLAYLCLGGNLLSAAISAALSGDQELSNHDYDLLVQALNDHFIDVDHGHPLAYADEC